MKVVGDRVTSTERKKGSRLPAFGPSPLPLPLQSRVALQGAELALALMALLPQGSAALMSMLPAEALAHRPEQLMALLGLAMAQAAEGRAGSRVKASLPCRAVTEMLRSAEALASHRM
jgi:hypothetical protein